MHLYTLTTLTKNSSECTHTLTQVAALDMAFFCTACNYTFDALGKFGLLNRYLLLQGWVYFMSVVFHMRTKHEWILQKCPHELGGPTYKTTKMAEYAKLPVQPRWTEHTLFTLLALNGIESLTRAMGHLDKFKKSLTTRGHKNYITINILPTTTFDFEPTHVNIYLYIHTCHYQRCYIQINIALVTVLKGKTSRLPVALLAS